MLLALLQRFPHDCTPKFEKSLRIIIDKKLQSKPKNLSIYNRIPLFTCTDWA